MTFNHNAHRDLWNWLSHNPFKRKRDWPGWEKNGGKHIDSGDECFACNACSDCSGCPLVWPIGHCYERVVDGETLYGLFNYWQSMTVNSIGHIQQGRIELANENIPGLIQLARRIRDLPLAAHSKQEDNVIFFDDGEPGDLEPSLEPDDDAAYDRRVDDALCGDDDWIIPYPIDGEF